VSSAAEAAPRRSPRREHAIAVIFIAFGGRIHDFDKPDRAFSD